MPARITGMIGTQQEGVAVHLIQGKISREWVRDFTRLHEQWNYDSVLVGYYASAAEGFAIALYAADHTERIKFLIAHRPGSVAPALAARRRSCARHPPAGRWPCPTPRPQCPP